MSLAKNKNYLSLIFAQFVEQVGDSLTLMTLILWASSMKTSAGSSSGNVSLLMLFIGLPIILIGPFAGVFIDRVKKKTMLIWSAAFKGSAVFCIFLFIKDGAFAPLIFGLAVLFSAGAQFFLPAKSALIPVLVEKERLAMANSVSAVVTVIVLIAGFATAGFVVASIGFKKTIFIAVTAYVVTLIAVLLINSGENEIKKKVKGITAVWKEFRDGMSHLFDSLSIKFVVRRVSLLMIIIGLFFVALSGKYLGVILKNSGIELEQGQALGIMLAVLGAGLVLGTVFIEKAVRLVNEERIIRALFPVVGIFVIVLFVWPNYYFLLCAGLAAGVAGAMVLGLAETIIQRKTKDELRGRLFAAYYFIRNSSTTIGTTLAGVFAIVISEKYIILLCGAVLLAYGIISPVLRNKIGKKGGQSHELP